MIERVVDATGQLRIAEAGKRVLDGAAITRDEALWLLSLEKAADIFELMHWAHQVRLRFRGTRAHLCSIVNAKAGSCPEDCRFCAQSAHYQTGSPHHGFIDAGTIRAAAEEAAQNRVTGLGLVAAWRGLRDGPVLDEVCERVRELAALGNVRADASLGMIWDRRVAERLREAGVECYNHNLETSRRFFRSVCTTHSYQDRLNTIRFLKEAGIRVCSGGILGLGETRADRRDLAFALAEAGADVVPINILNPISGTPFAGNAPVPPVEVLKTIACFRLVLPRSEITIAGGRAVNLRDTQCMVFLAGASGLMVGNYLTTLNRPVAQDLAMLADLGLEPAGQGHSFSEASRPACSGASLPAENEHCGS